MGVPSAGHAHWAEVGGSIIFVTYGSSLVCTKFRFFFIFWRKEVVPLVKCRMCQPQHDSPVSMVIVHVWYIGPMEHSGENTDKFYVRLFFSQ